MVLSRKIILLHPENQAYMKKLFVAFLSISLLFLFIQAMNKADETVNSDNLVELIEYTPWYISLTDSAKLSKAALYTAYQSFLKIKTDSLTPKDSLLTIIDYSKPSSEKRLYIIDLKNKKLLAHTLVAHGQNSGVLYAQKFSNRPQSHQSSLGMYLTSNTYKGKHGYSLRLNGLEKGLNDKARERAIVIHGASYVNKNFINVNGRIGRSFGCPALPMASNNKIIDIIKEGSFLYIYHPSVLR